jgi:ABC-2 type transport system ATP-binding protein
VIDGLRKLGKTVFLTNNYMDEAEALADRVAVIAAGRIVAEGQTSRLGGRDTAPCEIRFHLPEGLPATELPDLNGSEVVVQGSMVNIRAASAEQALWVLLGWAREHDTKLTGLEVVLTGQPQQHQQRRRVERGADRERLRLRKRAHTRAPGRET